MIEVEPVDINDNSAHSVHHKRQRPEREAPACLAGRARQDEALM
jgi:hypothetical protein